MDETVTDDNSCYPEDETYDNSNAPLDNSDRTIKMTILNGTPIATLNVGGVDMLCLAQISATILHRFSYNEIHNRRVALSISTKPCNASQMELLRCAGAVPPSSRRCGLITRHEADRLVRSFTEGTRPPNLPAGFAFDVGHQCGWGCRGRFYVEKYTSSRAKCIECTECDEVLAPNKFIFHSHRPRDTNLKEPTFRPADAANFNSWRRHIFLCGSGDEIDVNISEAWEDVKALFNGGNRQNVNVLTMTTLVSASVGSATGASTSAVGNGSDNNMSSAINRERPTTTASSSISPASNSPVASNNKRPFSNNKPKPPASKRASLLVPATQRKPLTVDDALVHTTGDCNEYNNSEISPTVPQCHLPTVLPPFVPPAFAASPSALVASANLWLVDTLFRSILTQQAAVAASSQSSLPLYSNELVQPQIFNAEQLAAINLVKNKLLPAQQLPPRQSGQPVIVTSGQTPTTTESTSSQFLIKNIVGMNDE